MCIKTCEKWKEREKAKEETKTHNKWWDEKFYTIFIRQIEY